VTLVAHAETLANTPVNREAARRDPQKAGWSTRLCLRAACRVPHPTAHHPTKHWPALQFVSGWRVVFVRFARYPGRKGRFMFRKGRLAVERQVLTIGRQHLRLLLAA
jgi:hypothetical protein